MIYLLLAIASSAMFSIIMRFSEGKVRANISMLASNYLMCLLMAGAYMSFNILPAVEGIGGAVGMGVFNGLLYPLGFALIQYNIRKNGVVMTATFMKLGLLVPMVVAICFFHEMPALFQIIGFCLAIGAILLINSEKEGGAVDFKLGLLVLLLLANGGSDAMSKVFEELGNGSLSDQFLFFTFFTAFLVGVGLVIYKKERPGVADIFYGLLVGVPNYLSARFLLKALDHMPAVIAYPTFSVASLVVITMTGVCFFRERLSRRQWVAVGVILVALALLNL